MLQKREALPAFRCRAEKLPLPVGEIDNRALAALDCGEHVALGDRRAAHWTPRAEASAGSATSRAGRSGERARRVPVRPRRSPPLATVRRTTGRTRTATRGTGILRFRLNASVA